MYKVTLRKSNRARRKLKIRNKIYGTSERPRLTVFRSSRYTYAQIINDELGKTLVDVMAEALKPVKGKNKSDYAFELGKKLAEKAKAANIEAVVFDRNGYIYKGRVQKLVEGVREGGLRV